MLEAITPPRDRDHFGMVKEPVEDGCRTRNIATAIPDRFLHRAELVQITGKSYRLEKAKKSPNDTKTPTGSKADE